MTKKLNLYPFDEFLKDFQELGKLRHQSLPESYEEGFVQAIQYFEPKCKTKKELQFRVVKFLLICEYLTKNINEFDVGDFAVVGSDEVGSLVKAHLLKAVHYIFTTRPLNKIGNGPSVKEVLLLADSFREKE